MAANSTAAPSRTARVLIADADPMARESLRRLLGQHGHVASAAESAPLAKAALGAGRFDLVIVDSALPPAGGEALLRWARSRRPGLPVIVASAYGTVSSAVRAMRQGAQDYLAKPVVADDLQMVVDRALSEVEDGPNAPPAENPLSAVIGQDPKMARVYRLVRSVAAAECNVLLTGESGTGKSLTARAIHSLSRRGRGPFVEVSCGAMAETLLESELFGHVRGAFTDAVADKEGKFAAAEGGTIFLDEIASASPGLQVKLLRVLQERCFEPVGSNQTRQADVRVLLASNRDLLAEVRAGRFREDLYYRVNVVNIELPPLRHRRDDVPLLAGHFLKRFAETSGRPAPVLSPAAERAIRNHDWPGNVRELENCIEHAVVLSQGAEIALDDLPPTLTAGGDSPPAGPAGEGVGPLREALAEPERDLIVRALAANDGSRNKTAETLGINRSTLYKKMRKYGLLD